MNEKEKSSLTDTEWMSLINMKREGLQDCCANISELRDQIIMIARYDGELPPWNGIFFLRAYRVARDGHDIDDENTPVLMKLVREVAESMGLTLEEIHARKHEGNGDVCVGADQVEATAQRVLQLLEERLPKMLDSREEEAFS